MPVTRMPLARTSRAAASRPPGWLTRSFAHSMIWLKPAERDASSFASRPPASVIVSIPNWLRFMADLVAGSDGGVVHQFETDPSLEQLGQRALLARPHRIAIDEC